MQGEELAFMRAVERIADIIGDVLDRSDRRTGRHSADERHLAGTGTVQPDGAVLIVHLVEQPFIDEQIDISVDGRGGTDLQCRTNLAHGRGIAFVNA